MLLAEFICGAQSAGEEIKRSEKTSGEVLGAQNVT